MGRPLGIRFGWDMGVVKSLSKLADPDLVRLQSRMTTGPLGCRATAVQDPNRQGLALTTACFVREVRTEGSMASEQ